jgi:four helix bundle protein
LIYSNLPVFKLAYDLNIELFLVVKKFEREYKYTLGEDMKKLSLRLIINIYKANRDTRTKEAFILEARANLEEIRLLIRITKDLRVLSLKKFVALQEKIEPISKQLSSWYNFEVKNNARI